MQPRTPASYCSVNSLSVFTYMYCIYMYIYCTLNFLIINITNNRNPQHLFSLSILFVLEIFVDIAFQSVLMKDLQNLKNQETVIFEKVYLNVGKAYNQKTGEFTAPVGAVYSFNWKTLTYPGKYFITEIVHNGNPIALNYCDGRGISTGYASTSNQAIIRMKKGDKAWIRTHSSYGMYARGGYWSNFSGYKV